MWHSYGFCPRSDMWRFFVPHFQSCWGHKCSHFLATRGITLRQRSRSDYNICQSIFAPFQSITDQSNKKYPSRTLHLTAPGSNEVPLPRVPPRIFRRTWATNYQHDFKIVVLGFWNYFECASIPFYTWPAYDPAWCLDRTAHVTNLTLRWLYMWPSCDY